MLDSLFLLLLVAVGLGVRQLTLAMPIPEEVVRQYIDRQRKDDLQSPPNGLVVAEDEDEYWSHRRSSHFDDGDDDGLHSDGVNIDGTPMLGDLDIHGNPFGVTDDDW